MTAGFRGWLSRRANGLYLLTYYKPTIAQVGSTAREDVYARVGDPVAYNNLCPWSVKIIWNVEDLPVLESVRVRTTGSLITDAQRTDNGHQSDGIEE